MGEPRYLNIIVNFENSTTHMLSVIPFITMAWYHCYNIFLLKNMRLDEGGTIRRDEADQRDGGKGRGRPGTSPGNPWRVCGRRV